MLLSLKDELLKFSKEELVEIIIQLTEKQQKLEAKFRQYENSNTPTSQIRFRKNTDNNDEKQDKNKPRFPGRPLGHKGSGIKIPKPDDTQEHKINKKGFVCIGKRTQYVIDFVDKPIIVTKHIIYSYRTPKGEIVEAPNDVPENIYGKNIQAFITLLRGISGVGHDKIASIIKSLRPDLTFCAASSLALTDKLSKKAEPQRKRLIRKIREANYSQQDETGLRQDGKNGYVWVFCNPETVLYEVSLLRSQEVPKRILGVDYNKPCVNDGWNAYNFLKKRQRCWPHLTRELDALALEYNEALPQSLHLKEIYSKAKEAKKLPKKQRMKMIEKFNSQAELQHIINVLRTTKGCKEFATTLQNAQPHLFTGVEHPEVPLDNNFSERKLKPVITHRKNMGCIRNEKGKRFIENTLSLIETWKLREQKVYDNLKKYAG